MLKPLTLGWCDALILQVYSSLTAKCSCVSLLGEHKANYNFSVTWGPFVSSPVAKPAAGGDGQSYAGWREHRSLSNAGLIPSDCHGILTQMILPEQH